ncbi:DUF983 domain-containing protein [Allorhizobium sp. BGMRC 0089]|uniref:DUF983 domain-containing protein n=1 Tax=Allorhizobium sonneratiae TaxID=2934936 RepID=UPI0020332E1C|nr:DUF983 domain-containing protein [Allorhizobium sonneratiae]MCM2292199.1 DUF983 domain-containing protein [Allorhizobium sonneratiae]
MDEQGDRQESEIRRFGGEPDPDRPLGRAIRRGLACICPACGEGRLFSAFLKPVERCGRCGEDYTPQRADDLPPYIVIIIVGHVLLGGYMMTDLLFPWSPFVHLAIWTPLAVLVSLAIIQPVKGAVVALQWALRMHGFSGAPDPMDP